MNQEDHEMLYSNVKKPSMIGFFILDGGQEAWNSCLFIKPDQHLTSVRARKGWETNQHLGAMLDNFDRMSEPRPPKYTAAF